MKKIGLLVAVEIESLLDSKFKQARLETVGKFNVYVYELNGNQIFAIHSGAGQIMAAAATEILISIYKVDCIINYGIVGALTNEIGLQQVCLIDQVVDYTFDTSEVDDCEVGRHLEYPSVYLKADESLILKALKVVPDLPRVKCASGPKFVSRAAEKEQIAKQFKCDIVEMEAAAILLTADMHGVKTLFIKGISDGLNGGPDEFWAMRNKSSAICMEIVMKLLSSDF